MTPSPHLSPEEKRAFNTFPPVGTTCVGKAGMGCIYHKTAHDFLVGGFFEWDGYHIKPIFFTSQKVFRKVP